MDLANLSIVALVLAQLLNSQIDPRAFGIGFIVFVSGYLFGFRINEGRCKLMLPITPVELLLIAIAIAMFAFSRIITIAEKQLLNS